MTVAPVIDAHVHVFCWGENPREGFISETIRRSWLTKILSWKVGLRNLPGETFTEKIRGRLVTLVESSSLDYAVILAQDGVYRPDGSPDESRTHFYVSNDYVFQLARDNPKILPGPSINPWRSDALRELDRCWDLGARMIKVHTAIQGVDPSVASFDPFYRRAAELGMVLMFHTGYEHSAPVICHEFTSPAKLARPLDAGVRVIAAHSGTCAFFDSKDYYPEFLRMMERYPNLYGDTSVMATTFRWFALGRLSRAPLSVRQRMIHGSDYPFAPNRLTHLYKTGLFPRERANPFDMDLRIKRCYRLWPDYEGRLWSDLTTNPKSEARNPK